MSNILDKVRKLNWLLQETPTGAFSFDDLCQILSDLMEANVFVLDHKGTLIGVTIKIPDKNSLILNEDTGLYYLPEECVEKINMVENTMANIKDTEVQELFNFKFFNAVNKYYTIIPIAGGGARWGTLVMTRVDLEFNDEDLVLGEYGGTIIALTLRRAKLESDRLEEREVANVQMAIGTLSYSETEAVQYVFSELDGNEGILVASRIADNAGLTRSVIVNALRKLESAGVIETRSLGMKGTRIKILNPKLKSELGKIGA